MSKLRLLKKSLYFSVAAYFRLCARIQLARWKPRIVVITGSSGKTSLLHLIESQLKEHARYSHHANSTFGIPFDILGLKRAKLVPSEWIGLFLTAPFRAFRKPPTERIYVAEVDCDRPGEGEFLGSLLKPEVTLWVNSSNTHSVNFDALVERHTFTTVEEAIAYEFGYLVQYTTGLAILNGDVPAMVKQLDRYKGKVELIKKEQLTSYTLSQTGTDFEVNRVRYQLPYLLPKEFLYSLAMMRGLLKYLDLSEDDSFSTLSLPPGRSSVLKGVKSTTLIDSSYNATPDGVTAILHMFADYPATSKWLVLGDMIELGNEEQVEHEKLARVIAAVESAKIVLIGPRIIKHTSPLLQTLVDDASKIVMFERPKEALEYILANLQGQETLLFKGARFLEGIVEHLLLDKNDAAKLCRREQIWQTRRTNWGL